jgi:rsbT co-antagonist protein RsbR
MSDNTASVGSLANEIEALRARTSELEQTVARYQQILDALPLTIFWKDVEGRYLGYNQRLADSTGFNEPAEMLGKTDYDLPWRDHADSARANENRILTEGTAQLNVREQVTQADGQMLWVKTNKIPLVNAEGKINIILGTVENITQQVQQEEEQQRQHEAIISNQASALAELSTPLIPLRDGVLLLPLVGAIDTRRTQQVLEALLEGISSYQAETAILDVTGVRVIDTQVADGLLRAARAAKLLGATVYLSGISAEIAQTLVQLGTDLNQITTFGSLQSAIARAFR